MDQQFHTTDLRVWAVILTVVCLTGCAYRAGYTPSPDGSLRAWANSRGVVTIERTEQDGARTSVKIDTSQATTFDRAKAAAANGWEKLCAVAGHTTPLLGD